MNNGKIKVLQFSIAESAGGRTQFILNLWNHIDRKRFEFDFITFSETLSFESSILETGARVYHIHNYPENDAEEFSKEFREILKNGYDIIHIATSYWKNTIIEKLARESGIKKIILHSHSAGIEAKGVKYETAYERHKRIRNAITIDLATDFLACSQSAADWLYGDCIPPERITVIHNGVDIDRFCYSAEKREQIRKDMGLDSKYVIGFVGRLEKVKNIDFIMQQFEQLYKFNKESYLLIVGDGSQREYLERKAAALFPHDVYAFIGKTQLPENYFHAMDVLMLPSFFEGFPLTLLEAQCTGLKCISSTNVPEEVIVTNDAERLPLEKKERWSERLMEYSHGYMRKDNSDAIFEKHLDIVGVTKKIELIYEDI